MPREFKRYELRSTRRPAKATALSTTVSVLNEHGESGYCYVSFAEAFVHSVGKRLPRGVAEFEPAYIEVRYNRQLSAWEVWARYFGDGKGVLLWATDNRPSWLNFYKHEANNGTNCSQTARTQGRTEACAACA